MNGVARDGLFASVCLYQDYAVDDVPYEVLPTRLFPDQAFHLASLYSPAYLVERGSILYWLLLDLLSGAPPPLAVHGLFEFPGLHKWLYFLADRC